MLKFNWKDWFWIFWVIACVLFSFCAIFWGIKETWDWLGCNASTIATWVQAIGSITVLYTGFRIANFQIERQEEKQKSRDDENARVLKKKQLFVLLDRMGSIAGYANGLHASIAQGKYSLSELSEYGIHCKNLINLIKAIDAKDFPDLLLLIHFSDVRTLMEKLDVGLNRLEQSPGNSDLKRDLFNRSYDMKKRSDEILNICWKHLDSIITDEEKAELNSYRPVSAETPVAKA